jgi:hypothetical protein
MRSFCRMMVTVEDEKLRPVRMAGNPVKIDNSATQSFPAQPLSQEIGSCALFAG